MSGLDRQDSKSMIRGALVRYKTLNQNYHMYCDGNPLKAYYARTNLNRVFQCCLFASGRGHAAEVGSGSGELLYPLSRVFDRVDGFDIDEVVVDRAKTLMASLACKNVQFVLTTPERELLDIPPASVDCLVANNVLEHITDSDFLIERFYRVLRDDGVLVVSLPSQNVVYRAFESPNDGHVLRTSRQIQGLIRRIERRFEEVHRNDLFPFWKTRAYRRKDPS